MEPGGKSKTDDIQRLLRNDILAGVWGPGSKLRFVELRERYNCSTGVLREALPLLVGEGLVTSEPQVGFKVMTVSINDLEHLTEARIAMETMVFRRSIEEGTLAWEMRLVAAHHLLASVPRSPVGESPSPDWVSAHSDFHSALLEGCSNTRLRNIATSLRSTSEVYRCWVAHTDEARRRDVASEHQAILDAALRRDVDFAVTTLGQHIQLTTDILIEAQRRNQASDVAAAAKA